MIKNKKWYWDLILKSHDYSIMQLILESYNYGINTIQFIIFIKSFFKTIYKYAKNTKIFKFYNVFKYFLLNKKKVINKYFNTSILSFFYINLKTLFINIFFIKKILVFLF